MDCSRSYGITCGIIVEARRGGWIENNYKIEVSEQLKNKTLILSVAEFQKAPLQVIPSDASAYQISPERSAHNLNETGAESEAETELETTLRDKY